MKASWALVALFSLAIVGCMKSGPSKPAPGYTESATPAVVEAAPDPAAGAAGKVDLKILSFEEIQALVASKKGKVVVMDAWSTSCEPCIKEFPHLVALSKKHSPDKLACVSLSFDYEGIGKPDDAEIRQPVIDFLTQQNAAFDNVMSNVESAELYKKFDLGSVPAVFVYDQNGNLAKRFDNQKAKKKEDAFTYAQVEELVDKLIAGGPEAAATPAAVETPATPATPAAPAKVEAPATDAPAKTEAPATPAVPETPAKTESPASPAAAESPAKAETPAKPATPGTPEASAEAGKSP